MGEPIQLTKGTETITVYGRHEAGVQAQKGYTPVVPMYLPMPETPAPKPVNATDAAIDLAAEHGIDLATVKGTGAGGRITVADVTALIPKP